MTICFRSFSERFHCRWPRNFISYPIPQHASGMVVSRKFFHGDPPPRKKKQNKTRKKRQKRKKQSHEIWSWKLHNGRALVYLSRADEFGRTAILIFILRHWKFHEWREISLNSFVGPGSPGHTTTPNNNLRYSPTAHLIFFLSSPCIDSK